MEDCQPIPHATLRTLRILLSAYACEPGKGSEPGTGWHLAMALSAEFEVTVLTRSNNRNVIEKALERHTGPKPSFIYYDLSKLYRLLKKRGVLPTQAYYALWQRNSGRRLEALVDLGSYDIFHHLTFNSFEIPPGIPSSFQGDLVRGPLGGGQTAPGKLLATLPRFARFKECLRSMRIRRSAARHKLRQHLKSCDFLLYANQETRTLLSSRPAVEQDLMIDVGVNPTAFAPSLEVGNGTRLFAASNFEPRKGNRLLLRAFQRAYQQNANLRLFIAGSGRGMAGDQNWVQANGLAEVVSFTGRRNHDEMAKELTTADFFIFPSLRDTSGAIVLEAMSCGLPVICLDHQGAALMVDESCGIRIPASSLDATIDGIARAMLRLSGDAHLRHTMGFNAREKVLAEFSWEKKAERIGRIYRQLAKANS